MPPALAAELDSCGATAARVIVKILGFAGAGQEVVVGRLSEHQDGQVAREAMRALARIGTPTAAALVARQIREARGDGHSAAEDALWHFPPAQTATQVRELLRSREFVLQSPADGRALDRSRRSVARAGTGRDAHEARRASLQILETKPGAGGTESAGAQSPMTTPTPAPALDPLAVLRGIASLRKLAGSYPAGHPMIGQKLKELEDVIAGLLQTSNPIRIDVIRGDVFLDGVASNSENQANQQLLTQLSALGIDSIHILEGVQRDELLAVAEFLWQYTESGESMSAQLAARNVQHISLGRLLPLDTRWRSPQWADAPTGPLDPDYAESLTMAQKTWEDTASGKPLDVVTVRDLVQLLIYKVARSNAALGQILAVKQYENLTYCHSVNVAMLSLLLGKQVGLDEADARGARRSRAAARRRQDADSARHRAEAGRARQSRAPNDRGAHDASAPRS